MKGLELSKAYFEKYGKQMLREQFPEYMSKIAVGLVGHGSECFGFDDEISADHDYEPGFCIFIRKEDEKELSFKLMRAYNSLPKELDGVKIREKSVYGTKGKGVFIIEDFYKSYTGRNGAPETIGDWLYTPSHYLAEATNGEVFFDNLGEFTRIREEILLGLPEDVRLKKISEELLTMAQTGQYNFPRMLLRGDTAAASLSLARFTESACKLIHLLNKTHAPYYKWLLKSAECQVALGDKASALRKLWDDNVSNEEKKGIVESFCGDVIEELVSSGLAEKRGDYLEHYAFCVNEKVKNGDIRNLSL